ncbi:D-alanyl-D-alanine carboxypeptidase [Candidatus Parcubacteria bacterium]|nr:D-alanyl-D-alanine carboxypeptidase [Candidatus Parcubacteria bacterium]
MIAHLVAKFVMAAVFLQWFPSPATPLSLTALAPAAPDAQSAPSKTDPRRIGVGTSAQSALVMDQQTGAILFEKNREEPRAIGSITKLMTAMVFLEGEPDLEARASLQPEDVRTGGIPYVRVGQDVRVRDLLYASLVGSDNSATAALVRLSGMTQGDFIARMNETAAQIGMTQTRFVDPAGLSANNTSVVMDLARLVDAASRVTVIRDATTHTAFELAVPAIGTATIENTNDLLHSFLHRDPYRIVTAKTGFLPEAGYCLGALFSRGGKDEIIVVVLGSQTDVGRFQDAKALGAWAYEVYEWKL